MPLNYANFSESGDFWKFWQKCIDIKWGCEEISFNVNDS